METNIDGDFFVYQIASACEGKFWEYKGERYEKKELLNKVLKEDGYEGMEIPQQSDPVSWESTKKSLISVVERVLDKIDNRWTIHISGKGNFRYKVATILPYKGHRTGSKPFHYDNCRQFLVDAYEARISQGMEADDSIGLAGGEIASLDKDLDCIPGPHYNWEKDLRYEVSEVEANRWFYKQCLMGDKTDNILGLYKIGEKAACVKRLDTMEDEKDMYDNVWIEYERRFGSYAEQFLKENAKLVWILQPRDNLILGSHKDYLKGFKWKT